MVKWFMDIDITIKHTSKCSSRVLFVNGRVGFVDEGRTLSRPQTVMMSGACPPPRLVSVSGVEKCCNFQPAPSVWYVWMVRSPNAAIVAAMNEQMRSDRQTRRTLHEARFIQCVRVNVYLKRHSVRAALCPTIPANLDVIGICHVQAVDDGGWGGTPIFMQLQTCSASLDDVLEGRWSRIISFSREAEVHR